MKKAVALIVSLVIAAGFAGCSKKIPLAGDQKMFAGKWIADDGAFVVIYPDGGGDLKTMKTSLTGGRVSITATTLTIGIGPIKKRLKINEGPREAGGRWMMVIDGIQYVRQ